MSDDSDTVDAEVTEQAQNPQTIDVDGQRVTQRPIDELLEAARHARNVSVDPFDTIASNSRKVTH